MGYDEKSFQHTFAIKATNSLLALAAVAQVHYNFPYIIAGGATTPAWSSVRQWTGYYTFDPVTDVTSNNIRCNVGGNAIFAKSTSLAAGSTVGFTANPDIYHPGPLLVYMAKVPAGKTGVDWDGSGNVWFKIAYEGPIFGVSTLSWPTDSATSASFKIPATTPSGDYLLRAEHIGLHVAQSSGGAQFYISCGQITVTGGGSGTPTNLVAFPGAYKATDPGILIDIYYVVLTSYTPPGPPVWTG